MVVHGDAYLPLRAYDPRDPSRVFVRVPAETMSPHKPRPIRNNPDGTEVAGFVALAAVVEVGTDADRAEVVIDSPTFHLLDAARSGLLPSTSDAARFHGLRRAAEVLARSASIAGSPLLVVDRNGRRYTARRERSFEGGDGFNLAVRAV
jgi:hypothetical protein